MGKWNNWVIKRSTVLLRIYYMFLPLALIFLMFGVGHPGMWIFLIIENLLINIPVQRYIIRRYTNQKVDGGQGDGSPVSSEKE